MDNMYIQINESICETIHMYLPRCGICYWDHYFVIKYREIFSLHRGWYWEWCTAHLITDVFFEGFRALPTHNGWLFYIYTAVNNIIRLQYLILSLAEISWHFHFNWHPKRFLFFLYWLLVFLLLIISQTQTIQIKVSILRGCMLKLKYLSHENQTKHN